MMLAPLEPKHAAQINNWRIKERHTLRTPFVRSDAEQLKFQNDLANRTNRRFFAVIEETGDAGTLHGLVACGGLTGIIWESGIAEISLITDPLVSGIGRDCVKLLLAEAFFNMGLQTVCGEVYGCGNVGFWEKMLEELKSEYETESHKLRWRKLWQGKLYDSVYFAFHLPSKKMLSEI